MDLASCQGPPEDRAIVTLRRAQAGAWGDARRLAPVTTCRGEDGRASGMGLPKFSRVTWSGPGPPRTPVSSVFRTLSSRRSVGSRIHRSFPATRSGRADRPLQYLHLPLGRRRGHAVHRLRLVPHPAKTSTATPYVSHSSDDGQTFAPFVPAATAGVLPAMSLPNTTFRDGITENFTASPTYPGHLC